MALSPIVIVKPDAEKPYAYKESERTSYPSVSFTAAELPEIKNWYVGEEYSLILKVRQTGSRLVDTNITEGGIIKADFEILAVSPRSTVSTPKE